MGNINLGDYKIDITFVIDATGSMGPIIQQVQDAVLVMHNKIVEGLEESGRHVAQLRINVIDFADYGTEGDEAIHQSGFFQMTMSEELPQFENWVRNLNYLNRGGDLPENGLEALYYAMQAEWTPLIGVKGRHIIVLITDAAPLALGERSGCAGYPDGYFPANNIELEAVWNEDDPVQGGDKKAPISCNGRRLILYVPNDPAWAPISGWEWTTTTYIQAARGGFDLNIDNIVADIVRSAVQDEEE